MFKRKKRDGNADEVEAAEVFDTDETTDAPDDVPGDRADGGDVVSKVLGATEPAGTEGPWDKADAPERSRLDLGGMLVPIPP